MVRRAAHTKARRATSKTDLDLLCVFGVLGHAFSVHNGLRLGLGSLVDLVPRLALDLASMNTE